ncbi:MAG: SDR family oxidoreductase [Phycisphaerales bacterium]|nr:SDR family oxidoreductase [Phycisphaerales bacterium]
MSVIADRIVLVTGASRGIGRATAMELADAGARVAIVARRESRLRLVHDLLVERGHRCLAFAADVSDRGRIESVVGEIASTWGPVDMLVNNAGVMPVSLMTKGRVEDWESTIDINLKGPLYCIAAVLPGMLERGTGHIVNVSSVAGRRVFPGGVVYAATKHGLHVISEGLRSELSDRARTDGNTIRVTVIAPGVVRTDLLESITDEETKEATTAYYDAHEAPLEASDIAEAIRYAVTTPAHVDVNEILLRPTGQVR